jgi:C4-dicarboxylate-specific signal transduction histidine kinase
LDRPPRGGLSVCTRVALHERQRTDDLSKSLDDLRAAQDRLVQTEKLASLGQLTAGIAHEIKNPLNFVNNFSAVSVELIEELRISNGFYAATKRKAEPNGSDYVPTVTAATGNLGESVEIGIRDNGSGIPRDVKEKMFNPFFTTKPAGEGTGLGLSVSHDIIVKQHCGSIEVDTQSGEFTEIRIILPRTAAALGKP